MAKVKQKPIPMTELEPKQEYQQEPYVPGYAPPYTPQTYPPQTYPPQTYPSQMYPPQTYTPEVYSPDPYLPQPFDPYVPQGGSCCDSSLEPPPYSCQEVPCDRTDPVCCMDNNPPVVVAGIFSSHPASTICPCCRQIITTEVVYRVGALTYAVSCGLCVVGWCFGCCIIPFLTKCCKDVDHYCPICNYHIYRYKRL